MKQINLLPWRTTNRNARAAAFFIVLGSSLGIILTLFLAIHLTLADKINTQQQRNFLLAQQVELLNPSLTTIDQVKKDRENLLKQLAAIYSLQAERMQVLKLVTEIPRIVPANVVLTSLKYTQGSIVLTGKSVSNLSVSELARRITASPWLINPLILEIKNAPLGQSNEDSLDIDFVLKFQMKPIPR